MIEQCGLCLRDYRFYAGLILCAGLVLSVLAYQQISGWQRSSLEAKLGRRARICQQQLQRELDHYLEVVRSINYFFDASREVTRSEFNKFVDANLSRHEALLRLAWVPRVPLNQRNSYEARARRKGISAFQVTEIGDNGQLNSAGERGQYFPVTYLEPLDSNQDVLGLDLASHPGFRPLLKRARINGHMVASTKISLLPQRSELEIALALSPVFRESAEQSPLLGFALSIFDVQELLDSVLSGSPPLKMDLWLLEAGSEGRGLLSFYGSGAGEQEGKSPSELLGEQVKLEERLSLEVADSRWSLVARPSPAFLAAQPSWQAPLAFAAIAAFSFLAAVLVIVTGHRGRRYQLLAGELREANEQLEANNLQLRATEKDLRKSEDLFRQLFEQAAIGIFICSSEHSILEANQRAVHILGYSRSELLDMNARDLIHPDDIEYIHPQSNLERMWSGKTVNMERRYLTKSGDYIHVLVNMARLSHYYSVDSSHMVMFQDISERKRAEGRVYSLAYFDELTGLPNRKLFYERLSQAVSRAERFGDSGAVFLLDIDRLRSVNDTLGQEAGDELIREVGQRIRHTLRDEDLVARVSGDEFMILAEGIDSGDSARRLGRRLLDRLGGELELSGRKIYPEARIGFTLFPSGSTDSDTLIKQADMAMSEAKKSADRIREFEEQEDWISREFHLEHDLKLALANEEFWICYQPQIDLHSGGVAGLEALLRWSHPEKGTVSPAEFIPVLERTGMIAAVDEWVIRSVCRQLSAWRERGFWVRASVNLSARELNNDAILGAIGSALEDNQLPAGALGVELTETGIMENVERASRVLKTLSEWGVRVALDDFGKGYSCLSYLQQLDVHVIKIDKDFVAGLPESEDAVTLVQTIIAMAGNMRKKVLAEGVEREEQRQKLLDLGCGYGQGFLWDKPQSASDLERNGWLDEASGTWL